MLIVRKWAGLLAGIGMLMWFGGAQAAAPKGANPGFSGGLFTCLQYINGLGENSAGRMQSNLAHIWVQGYLAGYYKAQSKLDFGADAAEVKTLDDLLAAQCQALPQDSILTVSLHRLAVEPHKLAAVVANDFSPSSYTCGQHLDAKNGAAAAANKADLAELWAFAFIQGFKNVSQPDMEINPENKPTLIGVVLSDRACGKNRDKLFMDYAAQVAEKVKLAP